MKRDKASEHLKQVAERGQTADEQAMYGPLEAALEALCPRGTQVTTLKAGSAKKPDMHFEDTGGGLLAYIEVKKPSTVGDAFRVPAGEATHQIGNYRNLEDPATILLTDGARWWDVTDEDEAAPFVEIDPASKKVDAQLQTLADRLSVIAGRRPRYRSANAAATGMQSIVETLNAQSGGEVADGWDIVRKGLGLKLDTSSTLDSTGPGEVVAFSLLALAVSLPALPDATFVADAKDEWLAQQKWNASALPTTLRQTFVTFRNHAAQSGSVPDEVWVTVRAIARWVAHPDKEVMWGRLSSLWDTYLHSTGRRERLGSWQTPRAIADLQATGVAGVLEGLGYTGLADPKVTVIDPCVGTGVYLDAVVSRIAAEGGHPVGVNPSKNHPYARIVGVDVSSTAVATTLIRLATQDVHPNLYLTDTLATGAQGQAKLFKATGFNPIVAAAESDHDEVERWSRRDADAARPPVLAVIGNPPYQRSGLDTDRYKDVGWKTDLFENWRPGSGGRGVLQDPFVAFWAWAFNLCSQPHPDVDDRPFGVVSFITNRSWITGDTFGTMRAWTSLRASAIDIIDLGPGSRGGGGGRWSEQPFAIEAGTAVVTVVFDPEQAAVEHVAYRKARWVEGQVEIDAPEAVAIDRFHGRRGGRDYQADGPWTPSRPYRSLLEGSRVTYGINASPNSRWIRVEGNRDFGTRHAYRAFDNRWSPTTPPPKASREAHREGTAPPSHAYPSADWRKAKLFAPHAKHVAAGGWYAVLQAKPAKPGPAVKPTRHLPDNHLFKGSEASKVVRVAPDTRVPVAYHPWVQQHGLDGEQFWAYIVAAAHHRGYWTEGHPYAQQLADERVEPPLVDDPQAVADLIQHGRRLVDLWSVDEVEGNVEADGTIPAEPQAEQVQIHGRNVLAEWRKARPARDQWDHKTRSEYARTVAAVNAVTEVVAEVTDLLEQHASAEGSSSGE